MMKNHGPDFCITGLHFSPAFGVPNGDREDSFLWTARRLCGGHARGGKAHGFEKWLLEMLKEFEGERRAASWSGQAVARRRRAVGSGQAVARRRRAGVARFRPLR